MAEGRTHDRKSEDPALARGIRAIPDPISLEASAYMEIKRTITEGVLKPGQPISVNAMAKELNVSRLPVLHALRRLASEGFVQLPPRRNAVVTSLNATELRGRNRILAAVEEVALRDAWSLDVKLVAQSDTARRAFEADLRAGGDGVDADRDFHNVVWHATRITECRRILEAIRDQGSYYRALIHQHSTPDVVADRIAEHAAIQSALEAGDLEATVIALRIHRDSGADRLERVMEIFEALSTTPVGD